MMCPCAYISEQPLEGDSLFPCSHTSGLTQFFSLSHQDLKRPLKLKPVPKSTWLTCSSQALSPSSKRQEFKATE